MTNIINIEDYDKEIRSIANKLCGGDKSLAEDLRNEMYISILTSEPSRSKPEKLRKAKFRAIDYLRSNARNYSYRGRIAHFSLEAMEESGFQIDTEGRVYPPGERLSTFWEDDDEES